MTHAGFGLFLYLYLFFPTCKSHGSASPSCFSPLRGAVEHTPALFAFVAILVLFGGLNLLEYKRFD